MPEDKLPKIAVQIPAWNQAAELVDCLNSLKEVKYSNLEVVVVNNGEDNTSEIIRRDFQWVTLIEEGVDLGFCKANNIGFRYCLEKKFEYILLLNGDTKVFADTISTLLQVMQNDPSIAIAGAKNILMENPYYTWGKYGEVKWSPMLVTTAGRFEPDSKQKQPPKDVDWVICNGCLIRAKVLEEIGLFDENYWMCDEDVEWSYRAKAKGYRTVYVDEAAILHKGSSSTNLANKKKVFSYGYFLGRNPFLFAKKYGKRHQIVKLYFNVYVGILFRVLLYLYQNTKNMMMDIFRTNRRIIVAYVRSIYPTLTSQKTIIRGVKDGIKGTISPEFIYIEIPQPFPPPEPKAVEVPLRTFPQGRKVKFLRWLGL
jgi:GT2 family glycosyltransferase